MYCEKCGQEIPDHAAFCGKCGAKTETVQVVDGTAVDETVTEAHKRSSGRWKLMRLLLLCMIVELVVGSCFMLRDRRVLAKSGQQNQQVTEEGAGISIGDIITFGAYEQDNNWSNGAEPLEWIVLDRQDDKVLLLSRYVIDCQQYHEEDCDITWAECDLRNWLNSTFYESAFDEEQQWQIIETEVLNPDNEEYGTPGGVTTYDKVFLLSLEEVSKYTGTYEEKSAKATTYAMDSELRTDNENYAYWWLRTPGRISRDAARVCSDGAVFADGNGVIYASIGDRPALWVRIEE